MIEKEKSKIPATGYDNKVLLYLGVGICLLIGSSILFLGIGKKKKKCEK
ncbi:MAG: LPXTG cell wall anchor domain-containing protein [Clostridium sp.]|nr:LPXTG cell wall anchor domain-containing protein [Clostridium sp.]